MTGKIMIYDEITVPSSQAPALRRAYMDRYAPDARDRGMTLEGAWRSPPIDIADRDVVFHILWSVPDVGAWWAMRLADVEAKSIWWDHVDSIATHRKRSVMTDAFAENADA